MINELFSKTKYSYTSKNLNYLIKQTKTIFLIFKPTTKNETKIIL